MLLLVTVAMLVIHLSSFASAKSNGDNLRHNDVTSKDATHLNVVHFVTSLLTSPGAVPDRVSSEGDTLRCNDVASKDVNVDNQVTSLLKALGAIPETHHRTVPEIVHRVIPDRINRAIPEGKHRAVPDTKGRAIPDRIRRAIPERTQRAIIDRHRRVVPDRKSITIPEKDRRAIQRAISDRVHRAIPNRIRKAIPKRLRRSTKPCTVDCSRVKHKPVCGTDRQTYRHMCELKRIRRCEGRRVRAVPIGLCTGIHGNSSLTAQLLFLNINFKIFRKFEFLNYFQIF